MTSVESASRLSRRHDGLGGQAAARAVQDRYRGGVADEPSNSPGRGFFVEVLLVGLIVAALALALSQLTGASAGSTPDWIAAISTFAAFVAAAIAAGYAIKAYKIQREMGAAQWRAEHRLQAALVSVWVNAELTHAVQNGKQRTVAASIIVSLRNASELPVHRVIVHLMAREADPEKYWEYEIDDSAVELPDIRLSTLPPSTEPLVRKVESAQLAQMANRYERKGPDPTVVLAVAVEFTDAAGEKWARRTDGTLVEAESLQR